MEFDVNFDVDTLLQSISEMQYGSEFLIELEDLEIIADKLVFEGEKEELSQPISEIKEKASDLGEKWLMCPLCQEAWEEHSVYAMVYCPKCAQKLHNPYYSV